LGRKSRAKAARRAERSRIMTGASVSLPDVPGRGGGANFSGLATPSAGNATPLSRLPRPDRSAAADQVRRLVDRRAALEREIEDEIRSLLEQGHSWTVVGSALGLSRQGARQRYQHLATDEPEAPIGTRRSGLCGER
jgi:hypothetical protein